MIKDTADMNLCRQSILFNEDNDMFDDGIIELKFRENGEWMRNWGGIGFPADTAIQDGPSIVVPLGNYVVTFNCESLEYNFINTAGLNENKPVGNIRVYPNPAQRSATFEYIIDYPCWVYLSINNQVGQTMEILTVDWQYAGMHQVNWDITEIHVGIYFYRLTADGKTTSGKLILN
jgi:hypothetical protein